MKRAFLSLSGLAVAGLMVIAMAAATPRAAVGQETASALPDGTEGFQGMVRGTIVQKGQDSFVLKVDSVVRVWKGNKAPSPQNLVGKEVKVVISAESRLAEQFTRTLAELKVGDRVEAEPFHRGGDVLVLVETLRKVGAGEDAPPAGADEKDLAIRRLRARVAELERQVQELKAENERLRAELRKASAD